MEIVYDDTTLERVMNDSRATRLIGARGRRESESPILLDSFLEDAVEVDVDAVRDARVTSLSPDHGARRRSGCPFR